MQLFTPREEAEALDLLGSRMTLLATADQTAGRYEVVLVDAPLGGDVVPHRHPWQEAYFVLDGLIEVQVGRQVRTVGPGSLVNLPARCVHGFRVTSDNARFLHISLGRGAVDAFRDLQAVLVAEPSAEDIEDALIVMARHGIEVVLDGEAATSTAVAS